MGIGMDRCNLARRRFPSTLGRREEEVVAEDSEEYECACGSSRKREKSKVRSGKENGVGRSTASVQVSES